jgi:hypothetical protein
MKSLKRIRYNTMNSWNNATSLAYNLKIHNVIDNKLQDKVYELMELSEFYEDINMLISDFDNEFNHEWQAGFNGRSGGYLVLYHGGKDTKYISKDLFRSNNGYNGQVYINDRYGWLSLEDCENLGILETTITNRTYTQPGITISDAEVPTEVKKAFRKLAIDIVKSAEFMAKNYTIEEQEIECLKTVKVLSYNN